eukprot:4198554-Prymnesium_polylepis.1
MKSCSQVRAHKGSSEGRHGAHTCLRFVRAVRQGAHGIQSDRHPGSVCGAPSMTCASHMRRAARATSYNLGEVWLFVRRGVA